MVLCATFPLSTLMAAPAFLHSLISWQDSKATSILASTHLHPLSLILSGGLPGSPPQVFSVNYPLEDPSSTWGSSLMHRLPGVSVLSLVANGSVFNSHHVGRSPAETSPGLRLLPLKSLPTFSILSMSTTAMSLSIPTTKEPLEPWTRAVAPTFTSTSRFVGHMPHFQPFLLYRPLSTSHPPITLLTLSHAERRVLLHQGSMLLLCSLRSSKTFLLMPVSHSFRPAWDARMKTGEAHPQDVPLPRPFSPPKIPTSRYSLSRFTFPLSHTAVSTTSSFPASSHTVNNHISLHSPGVPCTLSSTDNTPSVQPPQSKSTNLINTALPNLHHRRFLSSLQSPYLTTKSPLDTTPSSRAPRLTNPSHLRPPVLAGSRLSAWRTPFALRQRSSLEASLPKPLVDHSYRAVQNSLAPATRSNYGTGILRFTQFCDSWKISEEDRMPASAALLAAFVSCHIGSYSGKTIKSWLSGIRSWHIMNRAPWHGDDNWLQLARTAATKMGTAFKRPLRPPVSLNHLHVLRQHLNLALPFHAAIWATALVTFFGCRRLGETTVKSFASFDPLYHAARTALVTFRDLPNGSCSASFRIPWTKTTKQDGATIIITSRDDELCPVSALRNHLSVNHNAPSSMSFFAYRNHDSSFSHMLRAHFLNFVTGVWKNSSLDAVAGHSFRIGGVVILLLAGVSPEVVAATGGWTSLAFLLYWRRLEEIIPLCTSNAYNQTQISSLANTLEQFRIRNNISQATLSADD